MAFTPAATQYARLVGTIMVARRQDIVDTDEDGVIMPTNGFVELGNASEFQYSLTEEAEDIMDFQSGTNEIALHNVISTQGSGSFTVYSNARQTLELALRSSAEILRPKGSKTGANLIRYDTQTKRWTKVVLLPNLTTKYAFGDADAETDFQQPFRSIASDSLVVKDSSGTPKTIPSDQYVLSSWTRGEIQFTDLTTGGPYTAPITANFNFGSRTHKLTGQVFGRVHALEGQNISDLVIKDSAGTPATVSPTYYEVDDRYGKVRFKSSQISAYNAENYVEPLVVTFTHGNSTQYTFLSNPPNTEWFLRYEWMNTVTEQFGVDEFWRVRISPAQNWQLINRGVAQYQIGFTAMSDFNRSVDSLLGRVGRRVVINAG